LPQAVIFFSDLRMDTPARHSHSWAMMRAKCLSTPVVLAMSGPTAAAMPAAGERRRFDEEGLHGAPIVGGKRLSLYLFSLYANCGTIAPVLG